MKCTAIQSFAALAALPFLLLTADSATAQGPEQPTPLFQHVANAEAEIVAFSAPAAFHRTSLPGTTLAPMAQTSPSLQRVLLGTTLGTAAGAAVGAGVAALVFSTRQPEDALLGILPDLVVYGAPIAAVGSGIGTYLGSGAQASPWVTAAASVIGVGAGVGLGVLVGDSFGPGAGEYIGGATGAVVGISIPAVAAWASAR